MKPTNLRLAWIQSTAHGDWQQNLSCLDVQLASVQPDSIDLLVLPEAFAWLQRRLSDQAHLIARLGEGEIQAWCANWAKRLNCYVVAGSLPVLFDDGVYATLIVFGPQGELITSYQKQHLFSVKTPSGQLYSEGAFYKAGRQPVIWQSPWGNIGLAICFDLRFPSLFQYYAKTGCLLTLLPSAFTQETGKAHWHALVRARAIECQQFWLAVNQVGEHDQGLVTFGHSLCVNPWGEVLLDSEKLSGLFHVTINLQDADELRQRFPVVTLMDA